VAVIVAAIPEQLDGEFTVTVGAVLTINVLVPFAVQPPVFVIVTEKAPAIVDVKLATLPGLVTPAGTVQTYV
jgi:hypothetical protein